MLIYQILIINSIIFCSQSVQIPIEDVEFITHKESGFKLVNSKILINRADNIKGVIDDDGVNFLHFEIYDVKTEQSKKKIAGILEQFWNDAKMVPLRMRNQLEYMLQLDLIILVIQLLGNQKMLKQKQMNLRITHGRYQYTQRRVQK
ncbi:unnamed protein product (macronuclear) [Paramecium tetraurelia]|uniref:Uncharacterized protein n=1 Tax=Paramecium tetraurelia TaxID=5888 RepID=A0EDE7_PARTE|nr:uncharacterized protein GSPATT00004183001 [Paramecium tetraurelia]CAK93314.1 unnamed protein product [Paramecium tetraurelia]|eukprot:XP_001460711.1 hypothetical protein (macronuclear) [Paramecium tetraurelia strain d4-2]